MAGYLQPFEGSELVPGYRLIEYLGGGSLGDVWKASAPGGALVAMKIVNLRRSGTVHEFRALEQIKNIRAPHLVPVFAYWLLDEAGRVISEAETSPWLEPSGRAAPARGPRASAGRQPAWLVMAMGLGSKSLYQRLQECLGEGHAGVPWRELLDYMEDSARGIDYLNQPPERRASIIHGDIKPHNILIVGNAAQICDFGLARQINSIRSTNMPLGTVAYAPPELLQSQALHQNTDQYSLAISYVELRTGALPFEGATVVQIWERHLKGELDLSALKPCERAVIARAVALDPNQRWPSCREMVRALRRACEADEAAGRLGAEKPGAEIVPGCWLLEPLGRGALGTTWKARTHDGTQLALKSIDLAPGSVVAQVQSLRRLRQWRHERILPIQRLWMVTEEGFVYEDRSGEGSGELRELALLEPYAAGAARPIKALVGLELGTRNLADCCEPHRKAGASGIPWRELIDVLDDAAEGLDYLHQSGRGLLQPGGVSVHARIKPQNLILVGHSLKVADFGLHAVAGRGPPSPAEAGPYAPPEASRGPWLPASDQFALAVCYVATRAGLPAVAATDALGTAVPGPWAPIDLSGMPLGEQERAVLARALASAPDDRWPSCEEFLRQLRTACETDERTRQRPRRGAEVPGSEILPGYRLIEKLGQGQIGRVWKATGRGGMLRALKIVDLRGRAGLKELEALEQVKGIRSGNLVSISSYWLIDREGFILSDALKGLAPVSRRAGKSSAQDFATFPAAELIIEMDLASKTLFERLKECQREGRPGIPVDELLRYMEQAASGIDYLNLPDQRPDTDAVEIVHGDIKPQNIMIVGNTAAVGDFGLARVVQRLGIQQTGMGTCAYAAPELLRGQPHRTSDQYCLAMSYVELRAGRLPFEESDPMAIARRHLEGNLALDSAGLPPAELAVIAKATAFEPDDRYPSCTEMVRALRRAVEGRGSAQPLPEGAFAPPGPTAPPAVTASLAAAGTIVAPPLHESPDLDARGTPRAGVDRETEPFVTPPVAPAAEPPVLETPVVEETWRQIEPRPTRWRWLVGAGILVPLLVIAAMMLTEKRAALWWRDSREGTSVPDTGGSGKTPTEDEGGGTKPAVQPVPHVEPSVEPDPDAEMRTIVGWIEKNAFDEAGRRIQSNRSLLGPKRLGAIRQAWLKHALGLWQSDPDAEHLLEACNGILDAERDCAEAKLLRARVNAHRGNDAEARKDLQDFDPGGSLPPELQPLRLALDAVVTWRLENRKVTPALAAKVREFTKRYADLPQTSEWALSKTEADWMEKLRNEVTLDDFHRLLTEVKAKTEHGDFAGARESLAEARRLPVPASIQRDGDVWEAAVGLSDPSPSGWDAALKQAESLLTGRPGAAGTLKPAEAKQLLQAVGKLAAPDRRPSLDQVTGALRVLRLASRFEFDPLDLARLWHKRIVLALGKGVPSDHDLAEFEEDRARWERAFDASSKEASSTISIPLMETWRTEGHVVAKRGEVAVPEVEKLPSEHARYGHYVAALVWARQQQWDRALDALAEAVGPTTPAPQVAQVALRVQTAAELALQVASEARRSHEPDYPPANPFKSAVQAEKCWRVLTFAKGQESTNAWPATKKETLDMLLALAAWHKEPNDPIQAESLASRLLERQRAAKDLFPLLDIYLRGRLKRADPWSPEERRRMLDACAQLLGTLAGQRLGDDQAKSLAVNILNDVWQKATSGSGEDKAADEPFWAAVGEFYSKYPQVGLVEQTHGPSRAERVDAALARSARALNRAIRLAEKHPSPETADQRARYYLTRGRCWLELQPKTLHQITTEPPAEGAGHSAHDLAIADAEKALNLATGWHEAFGFHADVLLKRSRSQSHRAGRVADLTKAIESGQKAVGLCREAQSTAKAQYLLVLSMAYLERGNFDRQTRDEDFTHAADYANQAASAARDQKDFPFLALGYAHEDLAWGAGKDPEANYQRAVEAFDQAEIHNPLLNTQTQLGIARCYLRAATDSCLPRLKDARSHAEMLDRAKAGFEAVLRRDSDQVEAHRFLGQTLLAQGDFAGADARYGDAKKVAQRLGRDDAALFIAEWASLPLVDLKAEQEPRAAEALKRVRELDSVKPAPGGLCDPAREAVLIRARAAALREDHAEAQRQYLALSPGPAGAEWSDVTALLFRAEYWMSRWEKASDADRPALLDLAIADALAARAASVQRLGEAWANYVLVRACRQKYRATGKDEDFQQGTAAVDEAKKLAPRHPYAIASCREGSLLCISHTPGEKDPLAYLQDDRQAIELRLLASAWEGTDARQDVSLKQIAESSRKRTESIVAQASDPSVQAKATQHLEWLKQQGL